MIQCTEFPSYNNPPNRQCATNNFYETILLFMKSMSGNCLGSSPTKFLFNFMDGINSF